MSKHSPLRRVDDSRFKCTKHTWEFNQSSHVFYKMLLEFGQCNVMCFAYLSYPKWHTTRTVVNKQIKVSLQCGPLQSTTASIVWALLNLPNIAWSQVKCKSYRLDFRRTVKPLLWKYLQLYQEQDKHVHRGAEFLHLSNPTMSRWQPKY